MTATPAAMSASDAPPRTRPSNYPEPFAARMAGRIKRPLGDLFGLRNFGVNLTCLRPGAVSALHHVHSRQDEFIYVLEGELTLFTDAGATQLRPGMVAGFPANGTAHHLENRTDRDCLILEVGDRLSGDAVRYPQDDIQAVMGDDGKWRFAHKDGTPY
ncbi:MAG TPA: cupin domain-containing protein [Acetobacteraceae bacterium]|nr:cupin domain-containing protein [Acetobacteraceae bacterium]